MTHWEIIAAVYVLGFIVVGFITYYACGQERTDHGQIIIAQTGCMIAIGWPLTLVWVIILGVGYGAVQLFDLLKGRPS